MEVSQTPAVVSTKPPPTPKAIIHQKFGKKACYTIDEVHETAQNACPGLAIQQQGPCLYRCSLHLPQLSVTSEPFKRKKDAEQSAAKLAIEKLGIQMTTSNPTAQQAHDEIISRISYLFSDEFLPSLHPLTGHIGQALRTEKLPHGSVPIPILAACDSKLNTLCKHINPKAESDILLCVELLLKAARSCSSVVTSEENLWLWKQTPYSQEARQELLDRSLGLKEDISVEAVYIPCSIEKPIESVSLSILSHGYYMDAIAKALGIVDASHVLVSRTTGKTSSEMRIYFSPPHLSVGFDSSSNISDAKENMGSDITLNARACYLSGQDIHGDAILAATGYTWRSSELFSENITLGAYHRMLVGRLPDGGYKLSREAVLAAELPLEFTNRSNWRGSYPRDLLCMFCRQNWLSEPEFTILDIDDSTHTSQVPESCKKLKLSKPSEGVFEHGVSGDANGVESVGQGSTFRCEVKIFSKHQELIIECSAQGSFKKQNDAIQSAALNVLSWFNKYFKQNVPIEKWSSSGDSHGIRVNPRNFCKEFSLFLAVQNVEQNLGLQRCCPLGSNCEDHSIMQIGVNSLSIEGIDSGVYPSKGCLACICYSVVLKQEGRCISELLESCDEFEFEIGTSAVSPLLEACVTQMSTNQSACFISEPPPPHLILAAAGDRSKSFSLLDLQDSCLEYTVNLIRVTEPLEERMEQALFSPPLSKQRVEYALKHIYESGASTLVDFGCGSGSLLDSLMNYPTSLEKIAGVDISRKGLTRAAKVLHSKLTAKSDDLTSTTSIKSVVLYDGSITVFDHRLYGFDIGTCLEVIEHMEEDQAHLFGDVVLSHFRPKILIVSTPNYEYNPILRRGTSNKEEKEDDNTDSLSGKFRNFDHKFEWTRCQFNCWASELAARHNYNVEFSGVGGSGDVEPGFASQIAVFKSGQEPNAGQILRTEDAQDLYELIWEWDSNNKSKSAL